MKTAEAIGVTDIRLYVKAVDANGDYTGGSHATGGLTVRYIRDGGPLVPVSPVSQTVNGAHTDGGFCHCAGGLYRLDAPDAAFLTGARFVIFLIYGVTGVVFDIYVVELIGSPPRAAVSPIGDVFDELVADHQIANSFGEVIAAVNSLSQTVLPGLADSSANMPLNVLKAITGNGLWYIQDDGTGKVEIRLKSNNSLVSEADIIRSIVAQFPVTRVG